MRVYHYSSKASLDSIEGTGEFFPSSFLTSDDAMYGTGWYFTNLPPSASDEVLFSSLWGTSYPSVNIQNRVESYLEFEIDDSLIDECRSNVFKLNDSLIEGGVLNINTNYERDGKTVIKFIGRDSRKY